jgi:acyl-CoA thioesterase
LNFDKLMKERVENNAFIRLVGMKLTKASEGYARGELELDPSRHGNPIGSTHGGVLFSMCDTIAGTAATTRGYRVTTLSGTINYLNPAMNCRKLIGEAREIKSGKKTGVYEVVLTNENDKIIAFATFTFFHLSVLEDKELLAE